MGTMDFTLSVIGEFIALSKTQRKNIHEEQQKKETPSVYLTRLSAPDPVSSSSTGVIGNVCIFCMKKEKKTQKHKAET